MKEETVTIPRELYDRIERILEFYANPLLSEEAIKDPYYEYPAFVEDEIYADSGMGNKAKSLLELINSYSAETRLVIKPVVL